MATHGQPFSIGLIFLLILSYGCILVKNSYNSVLNYSVR